MTKSMCFLDLLYLKVYIHEKCLQERNSSKLMINRFGLRICHDRIAVRIFPPMRRAKKKKKIKSFIYMIKFNRPQNIQI